MLLLHLHTYVMLRCGIFSCTCTMHICVWGGVGHVNVPWRLDVVNASLALAHIRDATLCDLLLHLHTYVMLLHLHTYVMLLHLHTYVMLLHLHTYVMLLYLHTYVMLRCGIFSCICTMHICVWVVGDGVGWGMLTFHDFQLCQCYIRANSQKSV